MSAEPLQHDTQSIAQQLVEELRQDIGKPVDQVPHTRSIRYVYWTLGILAAVVLGGLDVAVLIEPGPAVASHPSVATLLSYQGDVCAQRQAAIMRAITAYARDHGEPPKELSALGPPYLTAPAVDPGSGRSYRYLREGEGASIACPNPDLHKPPPRTAHR